MSESAVPRAAHPPPYATIAFDCDSTLTEIEGIEELAGERKEEIRRITDAAMNGEIAIEAVYGARLAAVRPSRADVAALGRRYVDALLPNVSALVRALRTLEKRVCIVSGGLAEPLRELARAIGVDERDVHAVAVRHDERGEYAGFDERSPLARSGGKRVIAEELAREAAVGEAVAREAAARARGLAFVGDGITDLEAMEACARFVAFAGVARRPAVIDAADAVCAERDFAALLPLLCSPAEIDRLAAHPEHAPLVARARTLAG